MSFIDPNINTTMIGVILGWMYFQQNKLTKLQMKVQEMEENK